MPPTLDVNFGHEFFWGPEALENKCRQNSQDAFAEKFAGTFPKVPQTKLRDATPIRSAELRLFMLLGLRFP